MDPNPKPLAPAAPVQPAPDALSQVQIYSILATVAMTISLAVLATLSARNGWVIWLAVSVGGLGGLAHEFAQSGGKIVFFERKADGFYLGSIAGSIIGAVAGLLAVQGFIVKPNGPLNITELIYTSFLAGLALKGVAEAAGGEALPKDPVTAAEAVAVAATLDEIAAGGAPSVGVSPASTPQPPPTPLVPERV